jgi:hypothetical protein
MAVTNGYLTPSEASAYIGRQYADADGILDDVITAVSRMSDRHCGRHFYTVSATRYFDTTSETRLELGPWNDIVSITPLKSDPTGDGVYDITHSSTYYQLRPVGATSMAPYAQPYTSIELLTGATDFPLAGRSRAGASLGSVTTGRQGLIQIAGSWGWPTSVPIEVKQAARILCAEMAKVQDAPLGLVGSPEFGMSRVPGYMPRHARDLLAPFVHPDYVGIA